MSRDKKGNVVKEDSAVSTEMSAAGHEAGGEYTPYVYYEFETN